MSELNKNCNLLSKEEINMLVIEAQKGNEIAYEKLFKHYYKLIKKIAIYFYHSGVSFEDLAQEGRMGIVEAIKLFDTKRTNTFSTFVYYYIRKNIIDAVNSQGRNIKISQHWYEKIKKYRDTKDTLYNKLGRQASLQEIANEMHISYSMAYNLFINENGTNSLDFEFDSLEDKNKYTLKEYLKNDSINPENYTILRDLKEKIQKYFIDCRLSNKEIDIIKLRFGFSNNRECTHEEISKIYGVTRECIRQIEVRALKKMRLKKDKTMEFLIYMRDYKECLKNLECYIEAYKDKKNHHKSLEKRYVRRKVV